MDLFKLMGTIAVDNGDANTAIDETTGKAEGSQSKISSAFGKVAKAGAMVAGATVAAGAAMAGFATKAAGATDRVDKMSQKIGISRQAYQELDFICSQSGTSVDGLQMGMKTLTAAMDKAAGGTKANVEQFKKLGVSVTDSKGELRSQEDVFFDTISALQKMDNQTEKARLATELFGRSGTELMPLLNGAAGSIDEMKQQAHELGLVLDDETIDAGVQFTDAMDQVKRALGSVVTKIGVAVMPVLMNLIDTIRDNMPTIQNILSKVFSVFSKVVETAVKVVSSFVSKAKEVGKYLLDTFSPTLEAVKNLFLAVKDALQPLIDKIKDFGTDSNKTSKIVDILKGAIEALSSILTDVINGLTDFIKWLSDGSAGAEVFKTVVVALTAAFAAYKAIVLATKIQTLAMTAAQKAQVLVTQGVTAAQAALNTVLSMNPIGLVIIAITALVAAFIYLWNNCDAFREFWINLWEKIKNVISIAKEKISAWIETIKNKFDSFKKKAIEIKNKIVETWENLKKKTLDLKNKVVQLFENIRSGISEKITAARNKVREIFDNIKNAIKEKIEWARDKVSSAVSKVKSLLNFSGALTTVKTIFDNIKNTIKDKIEWARDKVKGAIDKIKGLFNFKFSWPKIPLPHFGISPKGWKVGDLLKGKIPKLSIDWYAKAMNNPMLLNKPTIFGAANGQLLGAGEAGSEIVAGTNTIMGMISDAVRVQTNGTNERLETLISMLAEFMPELVNNSNKQIVLNTGVVAGELAPVMDSRLGDINRLRERGR